MDEKQIAVIDYSPLQNTVTEEMRAQFFAQHPSYRRLKGIWIWGVLTVLIVVLIGVLSSVNGRFHPSVIAILALTGPIYAFIYFSWKHQTEKRVKLHTFASRNGLTYTFDKREPGYSGLIFNEGHSRIITEIMEFPNYEVGNFQYETGSGKHRQTHHFGYIKLKLKHPIPHIVLDAKKNNLLGIISNLPVSFSPSQTLELEGDFSKYFTLYVPETYERDALYILTPDVMASLIDESAPYDLEAFGNELYLYRGKYFNLTSPKDYEGIDKHINALNTEFVDQASGYKDERVAFGTQRITGQGAKLRTRIHPVTIIVGVFFLGYFVLSYLIPLLMYLGS